MSSSAAVIACVLSLLGRTAGSLPPIQLIDAPPLEAHPRAEAFVGDRGTIYLVTSSTVFQDAVAEPYRCRTPPMKKLASIVVHEERHIRYGEDESEAYHAQLTTLVMLGLAPDSATYQSVQKSMLAVLKARKGRGGTLVGTAASAAGRTGAALATQEPRR